MREPLKIDETVSLRLGRGTRLKHDTGRGAWTLQAPERVVVLDEIAHAVVSEIVDSDGGLGGVIDRLSQSFEAPRDEIAADVIEMLQSFVDKQLLRPK